MPNLNHVVISGKLISFPLFLPDATRAVVRSLDGADLKQCGVEGIVVNTFHLMINPGVSLLKKYGGVAKFMNFNGLVVSDSGGFQIMSLIHQKKIKAKISKEGIAFWWRMNGKDKQLLFTPEASIQTQFALNSGIMVALDYFTDPRAELKQQERSVELTVEWAKRSKAEFLRQIKKRRLTQKTRPWLMGVLQGGSNINLRRKCAEELVKLDFDVYGYGGWPMDGHGRFNKVLFKQNALLTSDNKPRFALGVGKPKDIELGVKYGYHFFDCVLPTRDARHGRLYLNSHDYLYINRRIYANDLLPISKKCQCYTCRNYSRGYLHHLFKIKDASAWRLATIHNLYFYQSLIKQWRNYKLKP